MRLPRPFQSFLAAGVVTRRAPDGLRVASLADEAQRRKAFLEEIELKIGVTDANANAVIEACYDILLELLRAALLMAGYRISGEGGHEAAISYLSLLGFPEPDVAFLNELRLFRNNILYEGERFGAAYAQSVLAFLARMYPLLKSRLP